DELPRFVDDELVEDRRTPQGPVALLDSQGQQEVSLQARPENAGVEDGSEHEDTVGQRLCVLQRFRRFSATAFRADRSSSRTSPMSVDSSTSTDRASIAAYCSCRRRSRYSSTSTSARRRWVPVRVKGIVPSSRILMSVGRLIPSKSAACCVVKVCEVGEIVTDMPFCIASTVRQSTW